MNPDNSILNVEHLSAGYGFHTVLEDVSFDLKKEEVLGIIGQNGSGKSTLLKAISGLIPIKKGALILNGEKSEQMFPYKMIKKGISYFTQGGLVMPALTVEQHFSLSRLQNGSGKTHFERVYSQFPRLYELRKRRAGSLSGGERQMLSFGILVAQGTKTWLLDEPTAGLSPDMVHQTVEFLQKMKKKENLTMLLVEHNMEVAFTLADSIAITKENTLTKKFDEQEFQKSDFLNYYVYN